MTPYYSVREVAELLAVRQHLILALIKTGQLHAVDVSVNTGGRPRWRIMPDDVEAFVTRRTHQPSPRRRRRKPIATALKRYFRNADPCNADERARPHQRQPREPGVPG